MSRELDRLRSNERLLARARLLALAVAVLTVGLIPEDYPGRYRLWTWVVTAVLAAGTVLLYPLAQREWSLRSARRIALAAFLFDAAVIFAFLLVYSFEPGTPSRPIVYLAVVEAALRYGTRGAVVFAFATLPLLALLEWFRADRFAPPGYDLNLVVLPVGLELVLGVIVGRLVEGLGTEAGRAERRAAEAEALRDALGRRGDLLDAAGRCARALSSSLELERAFGAFARELRGLVAWDRTALVLEEEGVLRVFAAAGLATDEFYPPGTALPRGSLLERVVATREVATRADMGDGAWPEEADLVAVGLRSRIVAPLVLGPRAIGILTVLREDPAGFEPDEVELVALLGRLVASAVQNIRAYDAERRTAEEQRQLAALRADFVSVVSHELRSPMAAVVGALRTLRERGRDLTPEQREAFLDLAADESGRLASLVADVLDTSRIDAGGFSYRFGDVDVAALAADVAAAAAAGSAAVEVRFERDGALPRVRGDADRLRQVLRNLVDNAVKYSPPGGEVVVRAFPADGGVRVDVSDRGPGIAAGDHALVFEKFGRAHGGDAKPGTGLGLFIARSIAEAHGGGVELRSSPGRGSTFTLVLPAADPG